MPTAAKPKLSKAELTWVTPLLKVWVAQNAALQLVSKTAAAKNALYLNTANNKKLAVVVGTLLSCKKPKDRIVAAGQGSLGPDADVRYRAELRLHPRRGRSERVCEGDDRLHGRQGEAGRAVPEPGHLRVQARNDPAPEGLRLDHRRRRLEGLHRLTARLAPTVTLLSCPSCPKSRPGGSSSTPTSTRSPIEKAGPAHIATLKTFDPPLAALDGASFAGARRRAKRLLFPTDDGELVLMVHLMSAGRLRYLRPDEKGPKTPIFRLGFADGGQLVLTEAGSKKRAGVWLMRPDAIEAELAYLGPEADTLTPETLAPILAGDSRRLHSLLRDQRAIAGIGRAWANEILNAARLSPYALSTQVSEEETERLALAIRERARPRASSCGSQGAANPAVYRVHDRLGEPCPNCRTPLARVDFEEHTIYYCPDVPDRRPHAQGPADVEAPAMRIEQAHEATPELLEAIHRLLPQLTEARTPPTLEQLAETVAGQTLLVARNDEDGAIIGTLTLIMYRVSSGLKGRIEDVIVDSSARGQGVGDALVREGMARANEAKVLMLELTSMPYRESANRLYKRLGFVRKPTNVYVWWPR